jgi:hypothetical protein
MYSYIICNKIARDLKFNLHNYIEEERLFIISVLRSMLNKDFISVLLIFSSLD